MEPHEQDKADELRGVFQSKRKSAKKHVHFSELSDNNPDKSALVETNHIVDQTIEPVLEVKVIDNMVSRTILWLLV